MIFPGVGCAESFFFLTQPNKMDISIAAKACWTGLLALLTKGALQSSWFSYPVPQQAPITLSSPGQEVAKGEEPCPVVPRCV